MDKLERGLRRDQKLLLVLAVIFFLPLLASWLWFLNVDDFRPQGSVAHGTLVQPVRVLEGYPEGVAVLRGRWVMVYVGTPDCDEQCRDRLYGARQVDTALGRDANRVERLYLVVGGSPGDPAFLEAEHPRLHTAQLSADDPWLSAFDLGDGAPSTTGRVYLVDPLGNLMMFWPADAEHRDFFDDLKRLLRVSRIG